MGKFVYSADYSIEEISSQEDRGPSQVDQWLMTLLRLRRDLGFPAKQSDIAEKQR